MMFISDICGIIHCLLVFMFQTLYHTIP